MSETCLFCKIADGEIKAQIVAETQRALAVRDIAPKAPMHCLVIPRAHIASLNDTDDAALLGELMLLAGRVARQEGIADSGYRVVVNTNKDGGQTVFHLHLHVMGGRRMEWPPG
jgi:histidine triad (HIT) family protein